MLVLKNALFAGHVGFLDEQTLLKIRLAIIYGV